MWPKHKRRKQIDGREFVRAMAADVGGMRPLARQLGVSDRTVRRWATGEDWIDEDTATALADLVPANDGSLPVYSPDMAIDGETRVGGVSEYSRRTARGRKSCLATGS